MLGQGAPNANNEMQVTHGTSAHVSAAGCEENAEQACTDWVRCCKAPASGLHTDKVLRDVRSAECKQVVARRAPIIEAVAGAVAVVAGAQEGLGDGTG